MEQIPAFWVEDRATSTSTHSAVEKNDDDTWPERRRVSFTGTYSPPKIIGMNLPECNLFAFFYISDCKIYCHMLKVLYPFGPSYLPDLLP